jgi:hypothetical protein
LPILSSIAQFRKLAKSRDYRASARSRSEVSNSDQLLLDA